MLNNLLNKILKKNNAEGNVVEKEQSEQIQNWFTERYETVTTQRNILLTLLLLSFIAVIVAVFAVGKISTSKSFSPFVIQIEEKTGSAKVVNPANSNLLSGNEALTRYFIKKYISARETYNPVDFDLNVRKVVRLFSAGDVYRDFIYYIKNPANDPTLIYAQKNTTYLRVKSFSRMGKQFFVRFAVVENGGEQQIYNKIATLTVDYVAMELSEEDRDINPVGFQVTGYRVDDDNS